MEQKKEVRSILLGLGFEPFTSVFIVGDFSAITGEDLTSEIEKVGKVEKLKLTLDGAAVQFRDHESQKKAIESTFDLDFLVEEVRLPLLDPMESENATLRQTLIDMEKSNQEAEKKFEATRLDWERRFVEMDNLMKALQASPAVPKTTAPVEVPSGATSRTGDTPTPSGTKEDEAIKIALSGVKDVEDRIKVQVDHVVRGDSTRIRPFSGSAPKSGESCFDDWSKQVELMLEDDSLTLRAKRQKLLGSLHSPALDIARGMGDASVYALYKYLEEFYATSTNGVKLLQDFFKAQMELNESTTDYLQRLSLKLDKVVKRGGLESEKVNATLFTHFKSTCLNERVSQTIHVKFSMANPPTLHELIKEVRTTEEDYAFTPVKQKARSQSHNVDSPSEISELKGEIQSLQQQFRSFLQGQSQPKAAPSKSDITGTPSGQANSQKKSSGRFCFNCGSTDGHMLQDCQSPSNPSLVHKLLTERQQKKSKASRSNLNGQGPRRH